MSLHAYLFIFTYGIAGIIGLALSLFWGRIARRRRLSLDWPWYHDRYYLVAMGFSLVSGGQALIDIGRTIGNIEFGLSEILLHPVGWLVFAGMFVLIFGLFVMIWIADLETHPPQWTWLKRATIFTVVWAIASFIINFYVPFIKT